MNCFQIFLKQISNISFNLLTKTLVWPVIWQMFISRFLDKTINQIITSGLKNNEYYQ